MTGRFSWLKSQTGGREREPVAEIEAAPEPRRGEMGLLSFEEPQYASEELFESPPTLEPPPPPPEQWVVLIRYGHGYEHSEMYESEIGAQLALNDIALASTRWHSSDGKLIIWVATISSAAYYLYRPRAIAYY